jgi:hypothetical protein
MIFFFFCRLTCYSQRYRTFFGLKHSQMNKGKSNVKQLALDYVCKLVPGLKLMTRPKGGQSEKNFDMADSFLVALHTVKSYRCKLTLPGAPANSKSESMCFSTPPM